MKLSALIAPLIAAKAPHDQIMAVIQAYEAQQEDALAQRRAADAERQNRKRERDKSRDITLRHSDRSLTHDHVAPVDDKTKTIDTTKAKNTTAKDLAEFRDALASLGSDRLDALVKVRQKKNAPLSQYAAKLLIKAAFNCKITIEEAADLCIERNWLTVKPDWIATSQPRGSPAQGTPGKPRTMFEATNSLLTELMEAENGTDPDPTGSRLEQNVRYLTLPERRS